MKPHESVWEEGARLQNLTMDLPDAGLDGHDAAMHVAKEYVDSHGLSGGRT